MFRPRVGVSQFSTWGNKKERGFISSLLSCHCQHYRQYRDTSDRDFLLCRSIEIDDNRRTNETSSGFCFRRRRKLQTKTTLSLQKLSHHHHPFLFVQTRCFWDIENIVNSPTGMMALLFGRTNTNEKGGGIPQEKGGGIPQEKGGNEKEEEAKKKKGEIKMNEAHQSDKTFHDENNDGDDTTNGSSNPKHQQAKKFQTTLKQLMGNQAVWLAILIMLVSAANEAFKSKWKTISTKFGEFLFITIEIRSHQPEYDMVMLWLAQQAVSQKTRNVSLRSLHNMQEDDLKQAEEGQNVDAEESAQKTAVVPGYGTHVIPFHGKRLFIEREIDDTKKNQISFGRKNVDEKITITILSFDRQIVEKLISEIRSATLAAREKSIPIYVQDSSSWEHLCDRPKRAMSTLYLPDKIANIPKEIGAFLNSKKKYNAIGVPWRRGYLLYGEPGTGKSSFIFALASKFSLPVYILSLRHGKLSDVDLLQLVNSVPEKSIIVLEDLDTAIQHIVGGGAKNKRKKATATTNGSTAITEKFAEAVQQETGEEAEESSSDEGKVSLSGLLNALDGVSSSEGRILFVTANNTEMLPKALLRPGRLDKHLHFELMKEEEMRKMMRSFFSVEKKEAKTILIGGQDNGGQQTMTQKEETPNSELSWSELLKRYSEQARSQEDSILAARGGASLRGTKDQATETSDDVNKDGTIIQSDPSDGVQKFFSHFSPAEWQNIFMEEYLREHQQQ